jgi:hypothetical protein
LLFFLTGTLQKLIVGSNANNGSKASLSYFNSNNGVSNANTDVSYLYFQIHFLGIATLPLGKR